MTNTQNFQHLLFEHACQDRRGRRGKRRFRQRAHDWNEATDTPMTPGNEAHDRMPSTTGAKDDPIRILIAEDDEDLRHFLALSFMIEGYEVAEVATGAELVTLLGDWILGERKDPLIDVLITDVRMPGFDGLRIVEGLCMAGWDLPTIIVSADPSPEVGARALACSTNVAFLPKPLNFTTLEARVRSAIDRRVSGVYSFVDGSRS